MRALGYLSVWNAARRFGCRRPDRGRSHRARRQRIRRHERSRCAAHYEEAMKVDPKNYEALWKASRSAVDLGSYERNDEKREPTSRTASCTPAAQSRRIRATRKAISTSPARSGRTR